MLMLFQLPTVGGSDLQSSQRMQNQSALKHGLHARVGCDTEGKTDWRRTERKGYTPRDEGTPVRK